MAFLDNSGDIILDATLTDTGRRRMAQGRFRIAKYALGDDEIDYSLYNKEHPSGSAYYDLKILQTPVFEAFSKHSANIKYGLLSNTRMDLLYLPQLIPNHKIPRSIGLSGSVYYCATNNETFEKIKTTWSSDSVDAAKFLLQSGDRSKNFIAIESGLNTSDFLGTSTTRNNFLINTNLKDSEYNVYCDRRFVAGVMGTKGGGIFSNTADGTLTQDLLPLASPSYGGGGRRKSGYAYYKTAMINAADNTVYFYPGATADTTHSVLAGPRGSIGVMGFAVKAELTSLATGVRSALWEQYGTKAQAIFGGSNLYDYIDTTVYVQGASSTSRTQFQLRIIRYAGT